jgi:putative hydrolase of the HAD superfamily
MLDWSRIDTLLIDMDGTILDLAYDNWFWRTCVIENYAQKEGISGEAGLAHLAPIFQSQAFTLPWYSTDYWSEVTGLNIAQLKRDSQARVQWLPGAESFLKRARAKGLKLWLCTNASTDSWQIKLGQVNGLGYFDEIICSHDFGHAKEEQAFWQKMHAKHPFDASRALMLDDNFPVLRAAREFGVGQQCGIVWPDRSQGLRAVPDDLVWVESVAELLL